jgi:chaperonin GroES
MKTIQPSKNNLFCKKQEQDEVTTAGIIIPESAQEETQFAEVVSVGDGVTENKTGDTIVYKEYTTTDIKLDDAPYFLINKEDVLGTVRA